MRWAGRGGKCAGQPSRVEGLPVQLQPQGRGALADLALGLCVEHALCILPIDGQDNVARPEVSGLSLAPLCHLSGRGAGSLRCPCSD